MASNMLLTSSAHMDYVKPIEITKNMLEVAAAKAALPVSDCNWMVCLAAIAPMSSTSATAKMFAAWMPIFIFFAQGFEHSVVNMFVIPTGMMLGAKVTITDWWLWNQIPVTIGNLLGGWLLIGLPMYLTFGKASAAGGSAIHLRREEASALSPK